MKVYSTFNTSTMINAHDLFNKKLFEFTEDLMFIFPEVADFRVFWDTVNWAVAINRNIPQEFFNNCVVAPYTDKILNRDETFFLQESYDEYNAYLQEYNNDLNLVQKLKSIWKDLDEGNKATIWTYLRLLLVLSEKCKNN